MGHQMETYNGPERRMNSDPQWRHRAEQRMKELDEGQLHIIKRLDAQDLNIAKSLKNSEEMLVETKTIRELSENMQAAGRFFNALALFVHRSTKFLAPIVAFIAGAWALFYAWTHGGKPPT